MREDTNWPNGRRKGQIGFGRWLLGLLIVLVALAFYIPTPYYVTRPGSALELAPIINVEGGKKDEAGAFMLTTVRMGEANLAWYLYANLSQDVELLEKALVLREGETSEDFNNRELSVMNNSQKLAEAVAFRLAGYDVKIEKQGVVIMGTIVGLPAKDLLKVGDVITSIDGQQTLDANELIMYLAKKKVGDTVTVTLLRNNKELKQAITLGTLSEDSPSQAGLGIRPDNKLLIMVPKKVTISSRGIGGPSAGLMMTLEIYDQLNKEIDLTRGYRIAGTGEIAADGMVGRIGGINHKIIAADNAGAEIFFAPDDAQGPVSNYQEAVDTAKRIGTKMQVVPVKTVDDALAFLQSQKPKHS